jgi:CheY-like chemotaxis protein
MPMKNQPSVLIVDRSDETLEVLQTALERRGLRTFAATAADRGLALARQHRPDLIVLDLEMDDSTPEAVSAPFAAHAQADRTPLVMLGTARRNAQRLPEGEFVAKPYHYGPLIRKIEELLQMKNVG